MLFDEAMEGLRSVFDTATDRTADAIENSKSYIERARLRSQLSDLYRRLGMAEYEAAINGVNSMDQINELMNGITELRQQMLSAERSLQKSGTITCPNCGKLNSVQDGFCPGCGTRLKNES